MEKINVSDFVYEYDTKHKEGFTNKEITSLCEKLSIDLEPFSKKLGVNTCMMIEGEIITYHCDVELAVRLCLENRERRLGEWD